MGQLELQDGFAPYFDPEKEIEVMTAEPTTRPRRPRAKPVANATGRPVPAAVLRKLEPSRAEPRPLSPSRQME